MCHCKHHCSEAGYTTILLVSIIGFSFLVSISVVSKEFRRAQDRSLAGEQFLMAQSLADACETEVFVRLMKTPSYRGEETIELNGHLCVVGEVTIDNITNKASFQVVATVHNQVVTKFVEKETL